MNKFAFAAEMKEATEAADPERRRIRFIASTEAVDRSGDVVVQDGIELSAYRNNPVVLWNHDHETPIARASTIGLENGRLVGAADFPPAGVSADSDRVYGLIKAGILNALSIGAGVVKSEPLDRSKPWAGKRYTQLELKELSIVSVPANPQSLIVARQYQPAPNGGKMDALVTLQKNRDAKFADFQTLASLAESRKLDDSELAKMTELETDIKNMDDQVEQLQKIEQSKMALARPVPRQAPSIVQVNRGFQAIPDRRELQKGEGFGMFAAALASTRMNPMAAAEILEKQYGLLDLAKALATTPLAAGGALVPIKYANEIIELLRERSVFFRAQPRTIDLEGFGSIRFPVQTAGTSTSYIGENTDISTTFAAFTELLLTPKKLAANTASSNELIRRSLPSAAMVMRDDLVAGLRTKLDNQMLVGVGSANAPEGLNGLIDAANAFGSNGTTLAQVTGDLLNMQMLVRNANVFAVRPTYFMSPRSEYFLKALRDGNGNKAFPEMDGGTLLGARYYSTTAIVDNGGVGTNESSIIFVDMDEVIYVQEISLAVDVSTEAAYMDGATLVSAWSKDQTVMRVISTHDMNMRHTIAGSIMNAVLYTPA